MYFQRAVTSAVSSKSMLQATSKLGPVTNFLRMAICVLRPLPPKSSHMSCCPGNLLRYVSMSWQSVNCVDNGPVMRMSFSSDSSDPGKDQDMKVLSNMVWKTFSSSESYDLTDSQSASAAERKHENCCSSGALIADRSSPHRRNDPKQCANL